MRPSGKGSDATDFVLDSGEAWVVDYGATQKNRRLQGVRLLVRGRVCDKQAAAMIGPHFDIDTFRVF